MQTLHFLYHEIRPAKSDYTYALDLKEFEAQAEFMAKTLRAAEQEAKPYRLVRPAITFDDGHVSNYEHAFPVLKRFGLSAHFFITAGWTGQRADYMRLPALRTLQSAGQQVGAHGWSHKLLTHCDRSELQRELGDARKKLEDGLGVAVKTMSLPGGRFNRRVLAACQDAGYERIFTSEPATETSTGLQGSAFKLIGRVNLLAGSDVGLLCGLLTPGNSRLAALGRSYRIKRAVNTLLGDALYARVWALANGRQDAGAEAGAEAASGAEA